MFVQYGKSKPIPPPPVKRDRVLVVDDSSLVVDLVKFALRSYPAQIVSVARPELGLVLLRDEPISLIMTDIKMPGMDGIEFLTRVRAIPGYEQTPILVMSGYEDKPYVDAAYAAGATGFIGKPFTSDDLLRFVMHELKGQPPTMQ